MATDTAVVPRSAPPDPTRHLWQAPVFLVALLFFVAAWQHWLPIGPPPPAEQFRQNLEALRNAFELVSPERDRLTELLIKTATDVDKFPEQAQQCHFLLGSGYARLAELTGAPDEARGYWLLAQQHFALVNAEAIKDTQDNLKLKYRRSKVRAAVGFPDGPIPKGENKAVRELISILDPGNAPIGEDPGEAARLQADLCLRLTPPDYGWARECLKHFVLGAGLAMPTVTLDQAKLKLGELQLRLKDLEKAQETLENISPGAAPDLVAAAKALLGRVHMANGNWRAATREWEKVRDARVASLAVAASYNLGVCKLKTNDVDAAASLLEETLKATDCAETMAAAFRLADLYLAGPDIAKHAAAADLLVRAMKNVKSADDLRANPNLTSAAVDVIPTFELAFKTLQSDGNFEAALKAVEAFTPIAEGGRDKEKRAEILSAWAEALKKAQGDFKPKAAEAAKEYAAFAGIQPAVSAKGHALGQAAAMYRLAGDPEAAVAVLEEASKLPELPDSVSAPIWLNLADALIEAKRPDEVWKVFNQAMSKQDSPVSTQVRLDLALRFKETNRPEFAKLASELLEQVAKKQNLKIEEQTLQERAQVELANLNIQSGNYPTAEYWLRIQLHSYPSGPEAAYGRFLLGFCLLKLAEVGPPTGPTETAAHKLRTDALELFRLNETELAAKMKKDDRDLALRFQSGVFALQALLDLRQPALVKGDADSMLQRHRGTVEELIIWSKVYFAFMQEKDEPKAKDVWDRMKKLFEELPPAAFTRDDREYSRMYWVKTWHFEEK